MTSLGVEPAIRDRELEATGCHSLKTLSSVLVGGHIFLYTRVFLPHSEAFCQMRVCWSDTAPEVCSPVIHSSFLLFRHLPSLAYMCPGQYVPQSLPDPPSFRKGRATEHTTRLLRAKRGTPTSQGNSVGRSLPCDAFGNSVLNRLGLTFTL